MPTVIERLREFKAKYHDNTTDELPPISEGIVLVGTFCDALPALLALADAVKAKDQAAIDKALADLEKEAT